MEEIKKENSGGAENIRNKKKKKIVLVILVSLILIGAVFLFFYLRYKATHISTDAAFVEGPIHTIASKVPGTVKSISVRDNQFVKIGDILLEIDPVDYDVKVKKASSKLSAERSKLIEIEAKIETSKKQRSEFQRNIEVERANLELQEANLKQADIDLKRAENLYKKDAIPKERYERTRTDYEVAVARVKAASEQLQLAKIAVETQKAIIKQSEAAKPSQLEKVRPGQKVTIKVDTYPGKVFRGRVESIMAGTGAVFSLFPPENATGSYVKVVQRIPVKIVLEEGADPEHILRIGMSVAPMIISHDKNY